MTKTFILPIGGGGGIDPSEKLAKNLSLTMDEDYVISASLIDQDGNTLGDVSTVDLPLESVVVDGQYDEQTKSIILTLENGNQITIPVGALVSGLVSTEQLQGLRTVVDTKQDQLTAGDNITIVDNVISAQGGGGGNAWYGTQAQFDALGTYDEDTDYFISDKPEWTEIKHRPNMSLYATSTSVDAKDAVLNTKINGKLATPQFMTQAEFDAITPVEGENYMIENETVAITFTFSDDTTATYYVLKNE